jgi:GAF domain-containing protein
MLSPDEPRPPYCGEATYPDAVSQPLRQPPRTSPSLGVIGKARFGIDAASPPGRALQTGQPVLIDDLRGHPEFRIHPVIAEHGIVSLLNVPVCSTV